MAKQKVPERIYGYLQGPDGTRVAIKQRAVVAAIRGHEATIAELETRAAMFERRAETVTNDSVSRLEAATRKIHGHEERIRELQGEVRTLIDRTGELEHQLHEANESRARALIHYSALLHRGWWARLLNRT